MLEGWMPAGLARRLQPYHQLMIRIPLGLIFIAHGGQGLFGWWGGAGMMATIQAYQTHLGVPQVLAVIAVLLPFFGGVLILIGLLTRVAALGLALLLTFAILEVHLAHGFFLNWQLIADRGHGIEMSLALLGMCLALVLGGPGSYAVDHASR